jgi:hypothetical protein
MKYIRDHRWPVLLVIAYALLAVSGLGQWLLVEDGSAYQGPGLDMVGYFRNLQDSAFLAQDFLVQSYHEPSPRHLFSTLIIVTGKLLGGDWYAGFFFWKALFVLALPLAWVRLLVTCVNLATLSRARIQPVAELLIILLVLFVIWDHIALRWLDQFSVRGYFSVAWWPPSNNYSHPQTFALLSGIWAAIISAQRRVRWHLNPYLLIATLIHPAISLAGYLLTIVSEFSSDSQDKVKRAKELIAELAIGYLLPALVVAIYFSPVSVLDADLFRYIYVFQAHPSHYLPTEYGSMGGRGSKFAFALVCLLLGGFALIGRRKRMPSLVRLSFLFLGLYILFAVLQYLAVYTISFKQLIQFGPIRLSMLGYWFVASAAALYFNERLLNRPNCQNVRVSSDLSSVRYAVPILMLALATGLTQFRDGDTYAKTPPDAVGLMTWAASNTSSDSTFAVPFGGLTSAMPINAGRAVFGGTGFPFVEGRMVEYCLRDQLLYGTPAERESQVGGWIGEKMAKVYQARTPGNFAAMARISTLNYVVQERSKVGKQWGSLVPDYQDDVWLVFNMNKITQLNTESIPSGVKESPCTVQFLKESDSKK